MKIKFLFVFILIIATACRQNAPTVNQNSQPAVSPSAIPTVSVSENRNAVNLTNAPETIASQPPKIISNTSPTPKPTASAVSPPASKFKNYTAKGVIKKIDAENNSVTIDHEDIGDYMVGMEMQFPVVDKNILKNLKTGDSVTFVLETGVGVERIVSIKKN